MNFVSKECFETNLVYCTVLKHLIRKLNLESNLNDAQFGKIYKNLLKMNNLEDIRHKHILLSFLPEFSFIFNKFPNFIQEISIPIYSELENNLEGIEIGIN